MDEQLFYHCSTRDIEIQNVYTVHRSVEESNFRKKLGNVQLLYHASGVHNFVGIMSR